MTSCVTIDKPVLAIRSHTLQLYLPSHLFTPPPPSHCQITDFSPKSGPYEGGTNITISGINLGRRFEDIYDQVTVAGMPCDPIRALYRTTRQIVCKVDGPGTSEVRGGWDREWWGL